MAPGELPLRVLQQMGCLASVEDAVQMGGASSLTMESIALKQFATKNSKRSARRITVDSRDTGQRGTAYFID